MKMKNNTINASNPSMPEAITAKRQTKPKQSLARLLTLKLSLLLIAVLLCLVIGSYLAANGLVHQQTKDYNTAISTIILDSVCAESDELGVPVGPETIDTIKYLSEYYCGNKYVDFVYTYIIHPDLKHMMVLDISERDNLGEVALEIEWEEIEFNPTKDELKLWQNEVSYITMENHFIDNSAESLCSKNDSFGNRIVVGAGLSYREIDKNTMNSFIPTVSIIIGAFILLVVSMYFIIRKSVLRPAKKLSDFMSAFIEDGHRTDKKLDEGDGYEFAMISSSFNKMSEDINSYIENIEQLNSEKTRQDTELDIASKIQQGFLAPDKFYDKDCEIFAMMTPAKNVGGDLYDYHVLDDGRILISVADVSGKGVAASMYMAVTLILMHRFASSGFSPANILEYTNNTIASNNKYMLFVTAFAGIYDPETGDFTYSNAGHNPPYLLKDKPQLLSGAKNTVMGLYEDETYTEERISLDTGDIIFLYTDGVTEATDSSNNFFGDARLVSVLESFRPSHEENLTLYVRSALNEFTGVSEQHDDITMLSFTVKKHTELDLSPDTKEFSKIKETILAAVLPHSLKLSLCVAAEEIFINICSYAFSDSDPAEEKIVRFVFEHSDRVLMRFEDNGSKYDPTANVPFDSDYDPDTQLGGLGKIIAFTIADKVSYEYTKGKNILTIIKYLLEV